MKIKGIEFNVNAAAGALGWWGEGYWYHKLYRALIPFFAKTVDSMNFVTKTTTWDYQEGRLALKKDYTPRDLFPGCIRFYFLLCMMLNAVKLSGPGFKKLLETGKMQKVRREAFGISFMPVGETLEDMLKQSRSFRDELIATIENEGFESPIWMQINDSCPNIDPKEHALVTENIKEILKVFQPLRQDHGLVLDLKINLLMPNPTIKEIWLADLCDIITLTNTIKFGTEDLGINWRRLFWWRKNSPLEKFGGGGLSGKPLFGPLCQKIMSLRIHKIWIPIKASGGISSVEDVHIIRSCGANAIEFATAISLRPWRITRMVKEAKDIF